jgi:hypothetical protein
MEKGIGKDGYFRFIFFFSNAMTSQIIITVEFTSFFKKETYLEPVLNIQNFTFLLLFVYLDSIFVNNKWKKVSGKMDISDLFFSFPML